MYKCKYQGVMHVQLFKYIMEEGERRYLYITYPPQDESSRIFYGSMVGKLSVPCIKQSTMATIKTSYYGVVSSTVAEYS